MAGIYTYILLLFPATEHFGIVFTAGYPKLLQLLVSDAALLQYPRLLSKVIITIFLEPALLDSTVVDAVKNHCTFVSSGLCHGNTFLCFSLVFIMPF